MLEKSNRPWGRYEVLQEGATYKVKSIHVLPGKRLSYQRHNKRSEHWYIAEGIGEVTLDGKVTKVIRGSIIEVPQGTLHRISNTGDVCSYQWADGNKDFDNIWTKRTDLLYA